LSTSSSKFTSVNTLILSLDIFPNPRHHPGLA